MKPSLILEKALLGEKVALLEVTWQIEKAKMSDSDALCLAQLDHGKELHSPQEKYLLALACY